MYLAEEVVQRLAALYPEQEWAFLPQVGSGTGSNYTRTADAIALNCWPSRGMELHGFEIKVYGGDFRRELANPAKAEAIQQFCDRWFIVVPNDQIVRPEELPPTWGLIVADESKPRIVVPAPRLDPKPMTRSFIAAVLRAAQKDRGVPQAEHVAALKAKWDEAYKAGARNASGDSLSRERVRWQHNSLMQLEKSAVSTLKSIRRELADVKRLDPTWIPPACEEPESVDAVDPHAGITTG